MRCRGRHGERGGFNGKSYDYHKIYHLKKGIEADVDVPLDITANELVLALSSAYQLDIDQTDIKKCYLQAENPIALLKGNKTLREYGLRNGSAVYYTDEG